MANDLVQGRNETAVYDFTITQIDGTTPVNLSGPVPMKLQARKHAWDAVATIEATIGNGYLALVSGPDGTLTWTVPAALTTAIAAQGQTLKLDWTLGVHTDVPHIPLSGTLTIQANDLDTPA